MLAAMSAPRDLASSRRRTLVGGLVAAAMVLAACGSSDQGVSARRSDGAIQDPDVTVPDQTSPDQTIPDQPDPQDPTVSTNPDSPLEPPEDTTPPPVGEPIPEFELVERSGVPFSRGDMDGEVWLVDLIFTTCEATCPLQTERMKEIASRHAEDHDLRFLSVSVDPTTDTPKELVAYAECAYEVVGGDDTEIPDTLNFHRLMDEAGYQ